jgi:hypothetical protein
MAVFQWKLRRRQAEIAAGLGENIAKLNETAAFPDDVEQIAVLARRRIGPFAGGPLPAPDPRSRTNIDRPEALRASPMIQ